MLGEKATDNTKDMLFSYISYSDKELWNFSLYIWLNLFLHAFKYNCWSIICSLVFPVFPFIIHSLISDQHHSISAILESHHTWLPSFINPIIYCLRRSWNVFMYITQSIFLVHDNTFFSATQSLLIWHCHHSILLASIYSIHMPEWVWLITQTLL